MLHIFPCNTASLKKYHPDLNKNFIDKEKKIREINKAYKTLMKYIENNNDSN